ncbi:sterile alpha motif domain-containing protein 11 [Geospiza fortis]|uniref:Sterile alpha motif domain-containing protein 11 n=1 Tax=Geospiza fortis TaxID=48883 RepID=A0A8N5EW88_GEOFO|nr:sterile alpha motif domain-containing protein 11 [Geospiza fortis]
MSKGILQVHPPICDCPGCRISSPVNRGRLAEKRSVPLPPSRVPKKELGSLLSPSEDSQDSDRSNGLQPQVKQEEDLHISIMKRRIHTHWDLNISFRESSCSRDTDLSSIISSLQQGRQLGMPESQSRCELKRNPLDVGLAAAVPDFMGFQWQALQLKGSQIRAGFNITAENERRYQWNCRVMKAGQAITWCQPVLFFSSPSSPPVALHQGMKGVETPGGQKAPEQMMKLNEILGKRRVCSPNSSSECPLESKKARSESPKETSQTPALEEVAQMTPEEHYRRMMSALNEHGSFEEQQQQRLFQLANSMAVPSHGGRDGQHGAGGSADTAGEISHPPPLLSPQNAPHIALGPHLRPPFLGVPSALCQTPGYGFLQPAQAEMFARQQEMLRKQNLARLEMSAELIRQKELENLHREIFRLQAACCPCGILMIYVPFSSPPSHNPGTMGGLFLDGEESPALEDISKWTVEDVCSFVSNLSGCTEYTQVFREQAIDGETLPLLTEEHLLNNMGLKLGPALKIRSQGSVASPFGGAVPPSRGSPKQENGNPALLSDTTKPPS